MMASTAARHIATAIQLSALLLLVSAAPAAQSKSDAPPQGVLTEAVSFASAALKKDATFHVLLPPDYRDDSERRYPVVYWLHGSNGTAAGASRNIGRMFLRGMLSGKAPHMIVVFPDGLRQRMWVNAKDGSTPLEAYVIDELVPYVDANFRTLAERDNRLIEGGSMGGYGALRLGFKYPQLFGAVSALAAGPVQPVLDPDSAPIVGGANAQQVLDDVYGGDRDFFYAQSPWALAEENEVRLQRDIAIRLLVGADDPVLDDNERLSMHLSSLGIPHSFERLDGVGHSPRQLFAALGGSESYWAFFREAFGG